jgi:hypothetical protein
MDSKDEFLSIKLVYIGDMNIEGTGNYETSIFMVTSENDMKIGVGPRNSGVIIEAKYLLQCPGLFDYVHSELWVRNVDEKRVETDHYT